MYLVALRYARGDSGGHSRCCGARRGSSGAGRPRSSEPAVRGMWFFFFSSRRRHTRCGRDWSSDVCSSDLSVHDLAKLRINRDPPPGVRRAFRWSLILAGVAAGLVAAVVFIGRRGGAVPVQTLVVTPLDAGAAAGGAGTAATANGYLVARTRASVSPKGPGRPAYLGVSER